MLRYKTQTRPGLRHPARKRSGSILTTPEPTRGQNPHTLPPLKPPSTPSTATVSQQTQCKQQKHGPHNPKSYRLQSSNNTNNLESQVYTVNTRFSLFRSSDTKTSAPFLHASVGNFKAFGNFVQTANLQKQDKSHSQPISSTFLDQKYFPLLFRDQWNPANSSCTMNAANK